MKHKSFLLLMVALLTTIATHAYDFQSGDLYYNITSNTTVEVTYKVYNSLYNYQGLTTATIPETVTYNGTTYSVTSIGGYAFNYCFSLTSITIPYSVTSIGYNAFWGCSYLTSITLPKSVTNIGNGAFWGCSSITSLTIPNSVTSIGYRAFYDCSSLTFLTIPNSVTSIGYEAFKYCSSLISITIPNSVTSIVYEAFKYCSSLISITIPNSVTSIGDLAFYNCSSLTSITIGNSVTSIGGEAFYDCSSLTSITCYTPIPPTCSSNSFQNVPRTIPLYVPAEAVEAYKAADTWKEFDVQALTTDATLSSLTYDGMLVPSFDAGTLHYTVDLPSETVDVPVVDAVANDPDAQVLITQATTLPGEASVEVLAADNTTRQTYTIYFSKKSTLTDISDRPDTTGTDSNNGAEKLLRDGQVLILRNGKTYNMMGQTL